MQQATQHAADPGWGAGCGWQSEPKAGEGDSDAITKGRGVLIWPCEARSVDEDAQDSGPQSTLSVTAQMLRSPSHRRLGRDSLQQRLPIGTLRFHDDGRMTLK